jgi:hypothetical protein
MPASFSGAMVNRTQALVLGFFLVAVTSLG